MAGRTQGTVAREKLKKMTSGTKPALERLEGRLLLSIDTQETAGPPALAAPARSAPPAQSAPPSPSPSPVPTRQPLSKPIAVRPPVRAPSPRLVIRSASANRRAHEITVTWSAVAGATGYVVERSADARNWSTAGDVAAGVTGFTDTGLPEASTWHYRVRARSASGLWAPSAALSATTATFRTLEAIEFTQRPAQLAPNVERVFVAYGSYKDAFEQPDEAGVRSLARRADDAKQILIFDVETWPIDIRFDQLTRVEQTIAKFQRMVDWARDERPGLKIGFYGDLPRPSLTDFENPANAQAWRAANDYLNERIIPAVDYLFPSYYASLNDPGEWLYAVETNLDEAKRFGKPVYPFIMPVYEFGGLEYIPVDHWEMFLSVLRRKADGMVLWAGPWGPWEQWGASAPWWLEARQLAQVPAPSTTAAPGGSPAPSAPHSLTVRSSGAVLNWADTSDSEDGFMIERSTDGVNFKLVGGTPRNVTTWQDGRISSGGTYHYRVRAFHSFGRSPYSAPAAGGPMSRLAMATNQAEGFDAAAGVAVNWFAVTQIEPGDYLMYRNVDFADGADQLSVDLGVADDRAGQRIEVRLDSLSGPVIGTLTIAGTGSYETIERQTAGVLRTTGVHDLYLVFLPSADGTQRSAAAFVDSFRFARGAPPAQPTRLVANSAGGRVDLSWADNSMDEALFLVERSIDGVNFSTIAVPPADQRNYSDTAIEFGTTYYYRVRAASLNGWSEPSGMDRGVRAVRDGFSVIQAEQFDVSLGVSSTGTTVGHTDDKDYIGFLGVDFGSGARTLAVRHGVANGAEGQTIEVRLHDPTGPLIGTLVTLPTGSYAQMQVQYASIQSIAGVHDVYLVFRGWFGASNMDWFTFLP